MRNLLRQPFWQAVIVLILAYIIFEFGIPLMPNSAPVPSSVVFQYMLTALVGVLLYVSADEARWRDFKKPIQDVMVDSDKRTLRTALLIVLPLLVGFIAFDRVRPRVAAPATLRAIHPAPPGQITFGGETIVLADLENPLRSTGSLEEHYEVGKRVYYQNCMPCHGDYLDGLGHYAHGFNPVPLNFQDNGTIAQLTESVVFWRIAKGGPDLPQEGQPWNSAMPVWEDFLTAEEIWSVIIFLYEQTPWEPRTWEEAGAEGGEH